MAEVNVIEVSGGENTTAFINRSTLLDNGTISTYIKNQNLLNGWIGDDVNTWSYSSADSPTFVISVNADMTGLIGVGYKISLVQTTTKYFIVTAVGSYSAGATLITVYGGTDYTLANAAITSPRFSPSKSPFGFPTSLDKWAVTTTDVTIRSQATPTASTWYNLGSISISVPIGIWRLSYKVLMQSSSTATQVSATVFTTMSTANNSESDADFSAGATVGGASGSIIVQSPVYLSKVLTVAAKTTYYLNTKTSLTTSANIYNRNDVSGLIIRCESALL